MVTGDMNTIGTMTDQSTEIWENGEKIQESLSDLRKDLLFDKKTN